ncbi:MAG: radical SAM family heme chaperone HemW [Bacteroidales bacterium]|nr:radical SAM family heme chaperone HemW [Bacteroidales bacterium]
MLYVHIPYCHRKCTYCAFYSTVTAEGHQAYVDAICLELKRRRHSLEKPLRTVYFGGGTPTLLSVAQLAQIVEAIRNNYDTTALEETTIEANPEDLTVAYLSDLRQLDFFNRISIGVQSFHDADLRLLNRRHDSRQAQEALENAAAAGFSNLSVDLIYGLPNQSLEAWLDNLHHLENSPVHHLSAYSLTVEEGTMLHQQIGQGRVVPCDEDTSLSHYQALLRWAADHDFHQYEISNFARPGHTAVHNSRYWNRTPYLGVGAAAHSFDGLNRRWNVADTRRYIHSVMSGPIEHEEEELTLKDAHNEYLMTALRTVAGIDKKLVAAPFANRLQHDIQRFVATGLILDTPTHYRPTPEGLLHADGIAAELFL